jgi:phage-related protein
VLFCIMRSEMLLLHGFIKKTRKTPKSDLTLAIGRKRRFEKEQ